MGLLEGLNDNSTGMFVSPFGRELVRRVVYVGNVSCIGPHRTHTDGMIFVLYCDCVVLTGRDLMPEDFLAKVKGTVDKWILGDLSPCIKQLGPEAECPSSAKVKNEWIYYLHSPYAYGSCSGTTFILPDCS